MESSREMYLVNGRKYLDSVSDVSSYLKVHDINCGSNPITIPQAWSLFTIEIIKETNMSYIKSLNTMLFQNTQDNICPKKRKFEEIS